jgi:hypothetical protein
VATTVDSAIEGREGMVGTILLEFRFS